MPKCFGSSNNVYQAPINTYDPLEKNGQDQRKQVYGALDALRPTLTQDASNAASALQTAAANPGYQAAQGYANNLINGDYLHGSPEFNDSMAALRSASTRQAGDQAANVRDQYSRAGMGFSTANQQAQQSAGASATAGADLAEAGARAANYANERNLQNGGVGVLNAATGAPANYLSQVAGSRLSPIAAEAGMIAPLSTGSTMATPQDVVQNQSILTQALSNGQQSSNMISSL